MQEVGRSSCTLSRRENAAKVKSAWIVAKCLGPPLGKAVQCDRWPRFALSAWKPPATADIAEKHPRSTIFLLAFISPLFSPPFFLFFSIYFVSLLLLSCFLTGREKTRESSLPILFQLIFHARSCPYSITESTRISRRLGVDERSEGVLRECIQLEVLRIIANNWLVRENFYRRILLEKGLSFIYEEQICD